jgi:ABC-type sulfate/molybdate transport systems ATPase subunit
MDRAARDAIRAWMDGLVVRGAAVVVVSHDIEPFVAGAARAITLRGGRAVVRDPLPSDPRDRRMVLEEAARPAPGVA